MAWVPIKNCKAPILKGGKRVRLIKEQKIRKCNNQIIYKLLTDRVNQKAIIKI